MIKPTQEQLHSSNAPLTKPSAVGLQPGNIPHVLKDRAQWVCWKFEMRGGKWTKVPIQSRNGKRASATDNDTWSTYEVALASYPTYGCDGIGFVFAADDPYCGIDLDGCIDEAGDIVPAAREIIDAFDSYTEVSPSGRGVKIFIEGRKPDGAACKSNAITGFKETEIYDQSRFFTVTGKQVPDTPAGIENRQDSLDALCGRLWPSKGKRKATSSRSAEDSASRPGGGFPGTDDELIEAACGASNGAKFRRLFGGDTSDHDGDNSRADAALCSMLAFWTGKDPDRMDRLFRQSGLCRVKWDENRGKRTYGQMTIENAIAACQETYSPGRPKPGSISTPDSSGDTEPGDGRDRLIPLGQRDPLTGRLVLSPRHTLPTAEAYVREFHQHADGRTLVNYAGVPMEWSGNRYCQVEEGSLKQRLQPWLHRASRYALNKRTGKMELVPFESNPTTVNQALESIQTFVHLPASTPSPAWPYSSGDRPPALELLPCKSLTLHIPSGRILAPTPALFTVNALDFDYNPDPEPPEAWIKFLEQLFGDDLESVELLQEWMGYCLIGDTSQQKMLLLVGPRRSGKGTIARIVTRLVGAGNVVGPTTSSLAGAFGLQPLIGKSLAIVSDARFTGESVSTVAERLLCISGEDTLSIDRKFLGAVSMRLPTRFMFLTNELPRLKDASNALAGRFLVLRLTNSFYGNEDVNLTDKLLAELPGILKWAIEGWKRLQARGRFIQPESGLDAIQDMEDLASPVGAFVRECCIVGVGHRISVDDLYFAWRAWCEQDGRDAVSTKQAFGRDLMASAAALKHRRGTHGKGFYEGICLREDGLSA
jgi:putative DNA primase/helicase